MQFHKKKILSEPPILDQTHPNSDTVRQRPVELHLVLSRFGSDRGLKIDKLVIAQESVIRTL